jgi:hypothetical protein
MQRWNRRVVSNQKNKNQGRKHRVPQSVIEDVVSSFMVEKFHPKIVTFANNLTGVLRDKAAVYAHGGYALYAAAKSKPEEVATLARSNKYSEVLDPVLNMPRDIDITVFPYQAIACNAFRSCMDNEVVKSVTSGLRILRREIHNEIVNISGLDALMESAKAQVNAELKSDGVDVLDIWIADTSHRHIEPKSANNQSRNVIVDRHNFRKSMTRCTKDNMTAIDMGAPPTARPRSAMSAANTRQGKCFPLRDHLNATIEFSTKLNDKVTETSDFILCRLALGVGITFTTQASDAPRTIEVPVNFVDVSITRKNDSQYRGGGATPQVFNTSGFVPFPSLEHIAHNNVVQHAWNTEILRGNSIDEDTRKYTEKTVKKLENRMTALKLLQSIPVKGAVHGSSSRGSMSPHQNDDDDPYGAVHKLTRAMRWLSSVEQDGVFEYIKNRMFGNRSRSPSGQGAVTVVNNKRTSVYDGSPPKTSPTRNPRTGARLRPLSGVVPRMSAGPGVLKPMQGFAQGPSMRGTIPVR